MSKTQQKLLALFVVIGSLQAPVVLAQSATEPEASNRITSVASQLANTVTTSVVDGTESLINNAMQLIGVRYRWGGNTPQSGLDCSGFVRYVFN
ncbi:MAG: C40 family peptidase, partial [Polynucleobacter victoriensis]